LKPTNQLLISHTTGQTTVIGEKNINIIDLGWVRHCNYRRK